jgi:hypothetical protein
MMIKTDVTMRTFLCLLWLLCCPCFLYAQDTTALETDDTAALSVVTESTYEPGQDSVMIRGYIAALSSRGMAGRGYVNRGMHKAIQYLSSQFSTLGLKPFRTGYLQTFTYPVNTFPGIVDVKINDRTLKAGDEFLVYPASTGCNVEALKLRVVDGYDFARKLSGKLHKPGAADKAWKKWLKGLSKTKNAYLLKHTDTICKIMKWDHEAMLLARLPAGIFLLPRKGKPTWSVAQEQLPATVIELFDTSLVFQKNRKITAIIQSKLQEKFNAANILGYVPGTIRPDSFIVLTAHFDHLGKMGSRALFPGASDNASGTAMLLNLARYYVAHPQKYSVAFIAFSGEEAGLLGSEYFTGHPVFPLEQIRFLVNMDIMGDATDGITVVNGSVHQEQFDLLSRLNEEGRYLPAVKIRGEAANSDHYPFSVKGVPAFFIYSNGGKGFYHDIWDKADQVSLRNIASVADLVRQFITQLQQ